MKGIILAGGSGTRLYPLTKIITKQLQPIYDKPMIYYPLSILMLGGIKDILIISTPKDLPFFEELLGNGKSLGINIQYAQQELPKGIPEAFTIGERFIGEDDVTLILGDNLFHGDLDFFREAISQQIHKINGITARVFAYAVSDPERYGVIEFDKKDHRVMSIEEKPKNPKSPYAIPGLYLFDQTVVARTKKLKTSSRGETEIVDLIKSYLVEGILGVHQIARGIAWLDTGTPRSLHDASSYIGAIEERQGLKVACLEEIALRMNFISLEEFAELAKNLPKGPYKSYLEKVYSEMH